MFVATILSSLYLHLLFSLYFFFTPRPPTETDTSKPSMRVTRPLYDIPYMYEAREFLRKKLIGKKVEIEFDKENGDGTDVLTW